MVVLTLAGFALRLPLLDRFPLREDEAIYSFWALHGWHVDPLFLTVWPDKPPIFLWLLALAYQAWGTVPAAARVLNIALSTATIPILASIARYWWSDGGGVLAAVVIAFNPFAISFASTAYTDTLLVLAGSLALCMAVRHRFFWAGVWLGIAIMTKQQGLFFVPLVMVAGWLSWTKEPHPAAGRTQFFVPALGFLLGLVLVILPILSWDSLRWAVAPSPWDLGARNVGTLTLVSPANGRQECKRG